jgi:ubiquinone/menaquinone biosynthesis C-methylase UbiE
MYNEIKTYLQIPFVYNLIFNVLNYNFNNKKMTIEFLNNLEDSLEINDLKKIHSYIKNNKTEYKTEEERVCNKINEITKLIPEMDYKSILDMGCGNGHILNRLNNFYQIKNKNSYGIDTVDYSDFCDFNYLSYNNGVIPLEDNTIDLITCLMVLHHTQNPEYYIREIKRVLKVGKKLIIRETDGYNQDLVKFNVCMEFIFYKVLLNLDVNITHNYFSKEKWIGLFEKNGFKVVKEDVYSLEENPFTPFYLVLEKL